MNNRKLLLIIGVLLVGVSLLFALIFADSSQKSKEDFDVDREDISLVNTNELRNILLAKQYYTVEDNVIGFLDTKINPEDRRVPIIGKPRVASNGNISFTVATEKPSTQFEVKLDLTKGFDTLVIFIPAYNYSQTIKVYGRSVAD